MNGVVIWSNLRVEVIHVYLQIMTLLDPMKVQVAQQQWAGHVMEMTYHHPLTFMFMMEVRLLGWPLLIRLDLILHQHVADMQTMVLLLQHQTL